MTLGLNRLTIRAALVLGFGVTVVLWLLTGYQFAAHMASVERESAIITSRYMQAQELLSSVRDQVLVASVYVRDALLDPSPGVTADYRRQLDDTYARIDLALQQYVPVVHSTGARDDLFRLRAEIDDFRRAMNEVLSVAIRRPQSDVRTLLNREVVPRRQSVIQVSDDVGALNRAAFVRHQADIGRLHRRAEEQSWRRFGWALLASLGVAVLATMYSSRLETTLRRQLGRDAHNTKYLRWLSEKLINAQEEERRNIARELHDEVGQLLTAMKAEISVAQRNIGATGRSADILDDAQAIATAALDNVRDLSHLLHPAVLDDLGLAAAVDWCLRGFAKRCGIKVQLREHGMEGRLAPRVELTAYRIVQESLTNIAKHADARSCLVTLERHGDMIELVIEDDGQGFSVEDPARTSTRRRLGLIGMRERVAQVKGTIAFESAPGEGTRVTARLPASPPLTGSTDDTFDFPGPVDEENARG